MTYRIIYDENPAPRTAIRPRRTVSSEEYATEHQALGRARELLETGVHHDVAVCDHSGNELCGVRLQWRLGGFTGD